MHNNKKKKKVRRCIRNYQQFITGWQALHDKFENIDVSIQTQMRNMKSTWRTKGRIISELNKTISLFLAWDETAVR